MSLPAPISGTNYALVFDDEFTGSSINTANWKTVSPWTSPVSSTWSEFSYTAVYPGVAHSPAWRNQPRMSWGVTRRSASPTAS